MKKHNFKVNLNLTESETKLIRANKSIHFINNYNNNDENREPKHFTIYTP